MTHVAVSWQGSRVGEGAPRLVGPLPLSPYFSWATSSEGPRAGEGATSLVRPPFPCFSATSPEGSRPTGEPPAGSSPPTPLPYFLYEKQGKRGGGAPTPLGAPLMALDPSSEVVRLRPRWPAGSPQLGRALVPHPSPEFFQKV
ncbi:hypothetical protein CRG98_038889 [Punica granatum]|uniref:Uncharacterized protein n=1 Tax=Punica granatum TaxID=22663 RepID=A0A2I0I9N5_PUNGR|nr:hypothetical protein CRG98_038889 [Punica granatum]